MRKFLLAVLSLALVAAFALPGKANAADTLMMATTTSTDDTGLLDYLAPKFKADTGIELKWTATGTGKALAMGKDCNVDVLLVHAPAAEKKLVAEGAVIDRTEVFYNDFVILGPKADPAKVKGKSVSEALKTIRAKKAAFVSRGDDSGTDKMEKKLWSEANLPTPDKDTWYVSAGQGMIATINMAAEKGGYTLADRGTFIKYEADKKGNPPVVILVEGDKVLLNQYSVIPVNPATCPNVKHDLAEKFRAWLASAKVQKEVAGFKLMNKQLFTPNAK
jgi:tungstate transport system substrate-binding protein